MECREFKFFQQLFVKTSVLFRYSYSLARGCLFCLAGISFLVLTACAGGGSGGGSSGSPPSAFEVELTFAPIPGGFRIGNQSDFGEFVVLRITATSGENVEPEDVRIGEFVNDSYDFTGLLDLDWKFEVIGILSDGGEREVNIIFVWQENRDDHAEDGIRSGRNTDGDGRANSVDEDDDNDGINDNDGDDCPVGDINWTSNSSTDHDGDGCRDESSEDTDDDNDLVADSPDKCSRGETGWESNPTTDNDGDGCLDDSSEDTDDDNDDLNDGHEREQLSGLDGKSCSLLADCDGDTVRDKDEVAVNCVIDADCDNDGVRDGDEEDGCVENIDCDGDGVGDGVEARGCAKLGDCDGDNAVDGTDIDDDGDGLIEIWTAAQLNSVRYALNGNGSRSAENAALVTTGCGGAGGIRVCNGYELVADISLASYANTDGGKGWQPLGHDTDDATNDCQGAAFDGIFDGNGWTISDLNISRSGENCVGLFGKVAADTTIRNLTLHIETVTGGNQVGGLVGNGDSAQIFSSSVVVASVDGNSVIGGLVGWGQFTRIYSSSVLAAEVSGSSSVGGLVGYGATAEIYSSSVVAGEVSASGTGPLRLVGGLVGVGDRAQIYSSSVVVDELSGTDSRQVGGLAGTLGSGKGAYSYVVSGSNVNMLVGGTGINPGVASYWDSNTSGVTSGNTGDPKTTSELRNPTDYADIYDSWDDERVMFSDGAIDQPLAVWCDKDHSGSIEEAEKIDDNLIWDFGGSDEYPAIRCTPISPTEWRNWWSLEGTPAKPQLNQMLLNNTLNPR